MMNGFRVLAALRGLRGSLFDVFGHTSERRAERQQLKQFEADLDHIEKHLTVDRLADAVALASVPMSIRGYGHVRAASAKKAEAERLRILERFDKAPSAPRMEAAE